MVIDNFASALVEAPSLLQQPSGAVFLVYSPSVFGNLTFSGGWRTRADIGPDRLYVSPTGVNDPQELHWNDAAPYLNWHVNDPSVVQAADGTLLMYVTALSNTWLTGTPTLKDIASHNLTGLATSGDGGASWDWQGVVVGQDNGLDGTGAWSPSAVATQDDVQLWYHTSAWDAVRGDDTIIAPRVLHTTLDASGKTALHTEEAVRTDTGGPVNLINVDVAQGPDHTYWMVGQDFWAMDSILAFRSTDGISWTPWSNQGPFLFDALPDGAVTRTPDIVSVAQDGQSMTLMVSSDTGYNIFDPAVLFDPAMEGKSLSAMQEVTVTLQDNFSLSVCGEAWQCCAGDDAHGGPVTYLERQFIQKSADPVVVIANIDNVFLKGGDGDDALQSHGGTNVLDGGRGSNWLVGDGAGQGTDTFFLDARETGKPTWSTVVGFHPGDSIAIWGLVERQAWQWEEKAGAPGYEGATMRVDADADGTWENSVTIAGFSLDQARGLTMHWGVVEGTPYLHLIF